MSALDADVAMSDGDAVVRYELYSRDEYVIAMACIKRILKPIGCAHVPRTKHGNSARTEDELPRSEAQLLDDRDAMFKDLKMALSAYTIATYARGDARTRVAPTEAAYGDSLALPQVHAIECGRMMRYAAFLGMDADVMNMIAIEAASLFVYGENSDADTFANDTPRELCAVVSKGVTPDNANANQFITSFAAVLLLSDLSRDAAHRDAAGAFSTTSLLEALIEAHARLSPDKFEPPPYCQCISALASTQAARRRDVRDRVRIMLGALTLRNSRPTLEVSPQFRAFYDRGSLMRWDDAKRRQLLGMRHTTDREHADQYSILLFETLTFPVEADEVPLLESYFEASQRATHSTIHGYNHGIHAPDYENIVLHETVMAASGYATWLHAAVPGMSQADSLTWYQRRRRMCLDVLRSRAVSDHMNMGHNYTTARALTDMCSAARAADAISAPTSRVELPFAAVRSVMSQRFVRRFTGTDVLLVQLAHVLLLPHFLPTGPGTMLTCIGWGGRCARSVTRHGPLHEYMPDNSMILMRQLNVPRAPVANAALRNTYESVVDVLCAAAATQFFLESDAVPPMMLQAAQDIRGDLARYADTRRAAMVAAIAPDLAAARAAARTAQQRVDACRAAGAAGVGSASLDEAMSSLRVAELACDRYRYDDDGGLHVVVMMQVMRRLLGPILLPRESVTDTDARDAIERLDAASFAAFAAQAYNPRCPLRLPHRIISDHEERAAAAERLLLQRIFTFCRLISNNGDAKNLILHSSGRRIQAYAYMRFVETHRDQLRTLLNTASNNIAVQRVAMDALVAARRRTAALVWTAASATTQLTMLASIEQTMTSLHHVTSTSSTASSSSLSRAAEQDAENNDALTPAAAMTLDVHARGRLSVLADDVRAAREAYERSGYATVRLVACSRAILRASEAYRDECERCLELWEKKIVIDHRAGTPAQIRAVLRMEMHDFQLGDVIEQEKSENRASRQKTREYVRNAIAYREQQERVASVVAEAVAAAAAGNTGSRRRQRSPSPAGNASSSSSSSSRQRIV